MKYTCYGCKYKGNKQDYPCTTCGTYVLSIDGESTVYVCNNWTPEANEKVDITVIQKPVSVSFECPCCDEEIEIDYKDFCTEVGDPCDWTYSKIKCPKCGKVIEIDDVSWD